MICIVCVTVGAVTGARGLFNRYTDGRAFQIASIATLVAGLLYYITNERSRSFHYKMFEMV